VEVTCLGLCPASNCLLVDINPGPRILVDCPLEAAGLAYFPVARTGGAEGGGLNVNVEGNGSGFLHTAQLGAVDPSTLDCVIITNFHNMLALPYITESAAGFNGVVLATEPTAHLGKLLIQEISDYISSSSVSSAAEKSKSSHVSQEKGPGSLLLGPSRRPYTMEQAASACSKILSLNFAQSHNLMGGFVFTPYSSGLCLGSANWLIASSTVKVAVLGGSAIANPKRHPLPLQFSALSHVDVAIVGDLLPRDRAPWPAQPPASAEQQAGAAAGGIQDVVHGVGQTLLRGGNVLLPVTLCGSTLDLIYELGTQLPQLGVATNQSTIYLISPIANNVLGYCEIMAEWLHQARLARVYQPESPFIHNDLIASGRLHVVTDVHALATSYKEPCTVMAGHPSLRFGPVLHFLKRWSSRPDNALIMTDPDCNRIGNEAWHWLRPHHPIQMRVMCAPLDARLSAPLTQNLLQHTNPDTIIAPAAWLPGGEGSNVLNYAGCLSTVAHAIQVPFLPVNIDVELAAQLSVRGIASTNAALLSCHLTDRDGKMTLIPAPPPQGPHAAKQKLAQSEHVVFGTLTASALVAALLRRGVLDCQVLAGDRSKGVISTVRAASLNAEVRLEGERCVVRTGSFKAKADASSSSSSAAADDPHEATAKAQIMHEVILELLVQV